MRIYGCGLLFLVFCPVLAGVTERPDLNPPGIRGLAPLESAELAAAKVENGLVAVFSGLQERKSAIYVRRYDALSQSWGEVVRLSSEESEQLNSRPGLYRGPDGSLHCVWLSRKGRGVYEILYSVQKAGGEAWTAPRSFAGGRRKTTPRLTGDGRGRLVLYFDMVDQENPWGRISVWTSVDGGLNWEQTAPGFAPEVKKGGASEPFLEIGEDGSMYLIWLDQTPGGKSVVLNVSADWGKSWLEGPRTLNEDKRFALSNPSCLFADGRLHVVWTVGLLEKQERRTEFWTDSSADAGKTWEGNRRFRSNSVTDVTLEMYNVNHDVGCLWIARGQQSGHLGNDVFWSKGEAVASEGAILLKGEEHSYFERLGLVAGSNSLAAFYSSRTAMDGGSVGVLYKADPGSDWVNVQISREKASTRPTSPVAVFDPETRDYNIIFHEKGRLQFVGAPERWDTRLAFSQFESEGQP